MQRIADTVRLGYHWYTTGSVALERCARVVRKFRDLYLVDCAKDQRFRRKRAGLGNAVLILWFAGDNVGFALFVSDGQHPAHDIEKLADAHARGQRFSLTGYELVQLPRARTGVLACDSASPPRASWTWRMAATTRDAWRENIVNFCRRRADLDLAAAHASLHAAPGFAGIRNDVRKLLALMRGEWARMRKGALPFKPRRHWYVQRLPNDGVRLSALHKRRPGQ